jgi:hypothetical protein
MQLANYNFFVKSVSQEQMSKDLMSLLVSSRWGVWSGYVHLLFSYSVLRSRSIASSKFQVEVPSFTVLSIPHCVGVCGCRWTACRFRPRYAARRGTRDHQRPQEPRGPQWSSRKRCFEGGGIWSLAGDSLLKSSRLGIFTTVEHMVGLVRLGIVQRLVSLRPRQACF